MWSERVVRIGAVLSIVLLALFSTAHLAQAAVTATVIAPSSTAGYASGGMYGGSLWLKSSNKILKFTGTGSVTTEYTIPTTINGVASGTFASYHSYLDDQTGIMYYSSGTAPIRIWSVDLNNFNSVPVLLFSGLTSLTCNAFASALHKIGNEFYFACPDGTLANNKLYKFTLPVSGAAAVGVANLTTVAISPVVYGFWDLNYRSQDGKAFVVIRRADMGQASYIAKFNPTATLPATLTTVRTSTVSGGLGGITGIDIDSVGNIFYALYQNSSGATAGFQITKETPTVTVSATYSLPTGGHDSVYSHEWILDRGSLSTSGTVIGYVTNGGGGIVKVSGAAVSTYISVGDLVIQNSVISFVIPDGVFIYRQAYTFTTIANTAGKAYFYSNGKPIAGCKGKVLNSGNSLTATCIFKPSNHGGFPVFVRFVPTAANFLATQSASKNILVSRRSNTR